MANGRRIPYTPVSVDYFQRGSLPSRTLYFLTHAHTGIKPLHQLVIHRDINTAVDVLCFYRPPLWIG